MYGTLHSIDMDADQNGQHITFQVTLLPLEIVNPKSFCNLCKARTKRGQQNIVYGPLNFNFNNLFFVVYDTFEKIPL